MEIQKFAHIFKFLENLWIVIHCICQLPNIILISYVAYAAILIITPILGLLGPMKNPDIYPAGIGMFTCFLLTNFLVNVFISHIVCNLHLNKFPQIPIHQLFSQPKAVYKIYIVFLISLVILLNTRYGFRYSRDVPQKLMARHINRDFYTNNVRIYQDLGYMVVPLDRNIYNPKKTAQDYSLKTLIGKSSHCRYKSQVQMFCGMPIYSPAEFNLGFNYIKRNVSPNHIGPTLKLDLKNTSIINGNVKFFDFQIEGPNIILIIIQPKWYSKLIKWNLQPDISKITDLKSPYIVHFSYGDRAENHTLHLYFKVCISK